MKTIKLQGKEYVQVIDRLKYFNEHFKDGIIKTSHSIENGAVIMRAEIIINGKVKATGHALKGLKQEFNLEKCETRAIGRALGIFGIGADNSISTYEEVNEAINKTKGNNNG